MSKYDVAVGLDKTTLDKGLAQLYADPQAREKLFKGSESGTLAGLPYTASWDMQAAPTFLLEPAPQDKWDKSINDQGKHPKPTDRPTVNAFQLSFTNFHASYKMGDKEVSGTAPSVLVFATVAINSSATAGDTVSISPASVWLDESKMEGWDRLILNKILGMVLQKAGTMLAGLKLPSLSYSGSGVSIELTTPVVSVQNSLLVVAASLKSKQTVDISGVTWPTQPLFALVSADFLTQTATQLAQANLVGKTFPEKPSDGEGDYKGVLKYSWSAKVNSVDNIQVDATDMTQVSANVSFGFSATVKPLGVGGPCAVSAATKSM